MSKTNTSKSQKLEKAYLTLTELLVRRCGMSLSILASGKSSAPSPSYQATDLLNCTQAAEVLGLSVKTLANWRVSGQHELPYRRIGGAIRYQYADLQAFADSHKRLNTSQSKGEAK
ncbi:helix-turn-helix domain-containing protein [Pseudochrobactrum asaccharolyticum]|uniref:Helix-turn-helix protein n=1 Tax=Pseudochrobactrum asaccharolyticum TaxID=354351 RepID=A0A366E7W2_9HYPH|nr:helix-turn-helix domain-containing protein [Pseudochrobactrum asaccharolyticum]MBX8800715.1 helix-turn-helix domain-containing protein [Ochrobactrum sp. MR28]MBX8818119.1 helix-turn-helix domain-containing protein [Ochrobactrum sp. MR31]RBO98412.1 helix-turn-helix protein [Pseudochrobactrum asaccharolyticum]